MTQLHSTAVVAVVAEAVGALRLQWREEPPGPWSWERSTQARRTTELALAKAAWVA